LARKREAFKTIAKCSYGTMGRSPDYMNSYVTGLAIQSAYYGKYNPVFQKRILDFYEYVKRNDIYMTHALGTPQIDRSKKSSEQRDPFLHLGVKEETSEGIIIRGAKQLATNAPIANELVVFPNGRAFGPGDERYCFAIAIPLSTPGLKIYCRQPLVEAERRNVYDHPLSSRFEESDALIIFEDVFVPWERVFFHNQLEIANNARSETSSGSPLYQQSAVRAYVKAGMAAAIAHKLADSVKTNVYPQVAERIGHVIALAKAAESMMIAAEQTARPNAEGIWSLNVDICGAMSILYPKFYSEMLDLIKKLGQAGLMLTPSAYDFVGPGADDYIRYFSGAEMNGIDRAQIGKLAWDFVGDSFAQRLELYERNYAGDPMFYAAGYSKRANISEWLEMVDGLLAEGKQFLESIGSQETVGNK
jgi:aromatic ring hydroxylase